MKNVGSGDEFQSQMRNGLVAVIPEFLASRRWFGGKARTVRAIEVSDIIPLTSAPSRAFLTLIRVIYAAGSSETYSVPLILKSPEETIPAGAFPLTVKLPSEPEASVLYDAVLNESFLEFLLQAVARGSTFSGTGGEVTAVHTAALSSLWRSSQERLQPALMNAEQSNTSVIFGKRLVLKIFRRLEEGINPDVEVGTFLTEGSRFSHSPAMAGHLQYASTAGRSSSLGIVQAFVPNEGDAWKFTLGALASYYDGKTNDPIEPDQTPPDGLLARASQPLPAHARERIGEYLQFTELLARRTAELHLALSSASGDPAFYPEPFTSADLGVFSQSALDLLNQTFELLREKQKTLPEDIREHAARVLALEEEAVRRLRSLLQMGITAMRTRIHGDYHLGQVLFTGTDFVIIDFEGEPARSLSERRAKRSPLQDVAGMLRSFHYAAYAPLLGSPSGPQNVQTRSQWADYWQAWVCATFLRTYLNISGNAGHIPHNKVELQALLDAYLLEKAIYELKYELNNRPQWLAIPLEGIVHLLTGAT